MKPPKTAAWRPTFGIGVAVGAVVLLASQASGSDPVMGLVLGGGAGILLGLTLRGQPGPVGAAGEMDGPELEGQGEER